MGVLSNMETWAADMAASFRRTDLFKALPFYAGVIVSKCPIACHRSRTVLSSRHTQTVGAELLSSGLT